MDHFSELSLYMIPIGAFMMGITGSIHCVAMCGTFATSCSSSNRHHIFYQIGRLISYSLLGIVAGFLGLSFQKFFTNPYIKIIPSVILSLFFIWWGFSLYFGKKTLITTKRYLPKYLSKKLSQQLGKAYQEKSGIRRSFFIGFFSAFLPCGLLYGVVISLALFQNPLIGMIGMFSFALGTIPGLLVSPIIIKKVFKPIKDFLPKTTSISLMALGLSTIIYRIYISYGQATCH